MVINTKMSDDDVRRSFL